MTSDSFDATEKMLDFVFKDDITDLQRAEILIAARMEDLKRTGQSTQRADEYDINHTNDEDDMNKARGCLSLISPDVYATYLTLFAEGLAA